MNGALVLIVRSIIDSMILNREGRVIGMRGQQEMTYIFADGREISQLLGGVRWEEDNTIEDPNYPYEFPAGPGEFQIVRKRNPRSPYDIWTTHPEGGICIHQFGRSEGCILIDVRTDIGLEIFNDLRSRLYDNDTSEEMYGVIESVIDRRSSADVTKWPVKYESHPQYYRE